MIGIEKEEKLLHGLRDDIDKRYLYVNKIVLENYQDDKNIKDCMALLNDKWTFYQYNSGDKKALDCDYFFWQYVPLNDTTTFDENNASWGSVEISVYRDSIDYDYKMKRLIDYIDNFCGINLKMTIFYGDVRNLIAKIDEDIIWENMLKDKEN